MHKFVFKIAPVAASRPRVTRYATFYSPKYETFRKDMAKLLTGRRTLYTEPLKLDVTFFIEIPKSYSKKKRDEMAGQYVAIKPDLDNLEKALYDTMNQVVWHDDSSIVEHTVRKIWVKDEPRIEVIIKSLHE